MLYPIELQAQIPECMSGPWMANPVIVAERVGFEPTKSLSALTPLAGERLQPGSATSPQRRDATGVPGAW